MRLRRSVYRKRVKGSCGATWRTHSMTASRALTDFSSYIPRQLYHNLYQRWTHSRRKIPNPSPSPNRRWVRSFTKATAAHKTNMMNRSDTGASIWRGSYERRRLQRGVSWTNLLHYSLPYTLQLLYHPLSLLVVELEFAIWSVIMPQVTIAICLFHSPLIKRISFQVSCFIMRGDKRFNVKK